MQLKIRKQNCKKWHENFRRLYLRNYKGKRRIVSQLWNYKSRVRVSSSQMEDYNNQKFKK